MTINPHDWSAVTAHLDAIRELLAAHRCDGPDLTPPTLDPNTCHVCGKRPGVDKEGLLNLHVPTGATKPVWPVMWEICRASKVRAGEPAPDEFDLKQYQANLAAARPTKRKPR